MRASAILLMLVILLISGCSEAENLGASQPPTNIKPTEVTPMSEASLSVAHQQALLEAVATQQKTSADQLKITEVKEADWPDACLGLAGPDEFCAQMIVPGWAVSVSDGTTTWQYRTDLEMDMVKLDQQ